MSELKRGDRVLVKNLLEKGGLEKLRLFQENTIYEVGDRNDPHNAVCTVKPLNAQGRERVLHCNLLLPCLYLPNEADTGNEQCRSMPEIPFKLQRMQLPPPTESDQLPVNCNIDQDEDDSLHQFDPNQLDTAAS